jgi:putative aldouronate transport system permease protein
MWGGIQLPDIVRVRKATLTKGSLGIQNLKNNMLIYILLLPAIVITFIFAYLPMPGILIAFQDYNIFKGISGSPWVGAKHFINIIQLPALSHAVVNTLTLSTLTLAVCFPSAIILALLFNELKVGVFKKVVQTMSYLPYFLSWISVIGIAITFLSIYGSVNDLGVALFGEGYERVMFLSKQELFVPILLILALWKSVGWNSIIFLAAITSIDEQLYEAARMDGATRLQQTRHITLPCIKPTIIILLIFSMGSIFADNFELVYGMQNAYIKFDVISTIVYSRGIQQANYSMAAAVGFFNGLISLLLVFSANKIAKKVSDVYIW